MQYLQTACKIEQRSLALAMSLYDRFFFEHKENVAPEGRKSGSID